MEYGNLFEYGNKGKYFTHDLIPTFSVTQKFRYSGAYFKSTADFR